MGYDVYGLNPKENTPKPAILNGEPWKMEEDERKTCKFVSTEGCTIYQDRPGACRAGSAGAA